MQVWFRMLETLAEPIRARYHSMTKVLPCYGTLLNHSTVSFCVPCRAQSFMLPNFLPLDLFSLSATSMKVQRPPATLRNSTGTTKHFHTKMSTSNSATNLYYCIRNAEEREFRNDATSTHSRHQPWKEPIDALQRTRMLRAIRQQGAARLRFLEDRLERALVIREIRISNETYRIRESFREKLDELRAHRRDLQALLITATKRSESARETFNCAAEIRRKHEREDNAEHCQAVYQRAWQALVQSQVGAGRVRKALEETQRLYKDAKKAFKEADLLLVASWSDDPEGVLAGTVRGSD